MGLPNAAPFELVASSDVEVYVAPLATAFPDVDEAPAVAWKKVGTYGNLNIHPDGITVEQGQSIEKFRALGDVGVRKVGRTADDLMFTLTIWDLTVEQYAHALNGNTITTQSAGPGTPGKKTIGLSRGSSVSTMALLFRAPSPYMDDGVMQFCVPRACQTGNPKPKFNPKEPAGLELQFQALVDPNAATPDKRYGYIEAQTAVAA